MKNTLLLWLLTGCLIGILSQEQQTEEEVLDSMVGQQHRSIEDEENNLDTRTRVTEMVESEEEERGVDLSQEEGYITEDDDDVTQHSVEKKEISDEQVTEAEVQFVFYVVFKLV